MLVFAACAGDDLSWVFTTICKVREGGLTVRDQLSSHSCAMKVERRGFGEFISSG